MSERVFERANQGDGAFVAGFAATGHWCSVETATLDRLHDSMVHQ